MYTHVTYIFFYFLQQQDYLRRKNQASRIQYSVITNVMTGRFNSLIPVDIPGHTKVSYFSHSVFSFTGQQTIPGSNVSGIEGQGKLM